MITFDQSKCTGCGACALDCFPQSIRLANGLPLMSGRCVLCGHCVAICPTGAVSIQESGYDMADARAMIPPTPPPDPDALLAFMQERRTIRQFTDQPVAAEDLHRILEAGRATATASNLQGNTYAVVQTSLPQLRELTTSSLQALGQAILQTPEKHSPLVRFYGQFWLDMAAAYRADPVGYDRLFFHAPAVLVVASDSAVDAPLAASRMELMANALGLGAMYSGFFVRAAQANPAIGEFLGIPAHKPVQVCLTLGHPAVQYHRTAPRKPVDVVYR